jgi:DNA invertase Pin-like site-specific DNA recombinase
VRPLAAYTRVSSQGDRDDQELHSHDLQRARIEAGAKGLGHDVLPDRFEDTDASGGTMDRPQFNLVMEGIRSGEYGGVVVANLSRFGRTVRGALGAIEEIEGAGGTFVCLDPTIDTSTPSGRFVLTVFLGLYAMEREATAVIAHAVKDVKIAEGVHQATHAPAGYDYSIVGYKLDRKTGAEVPIRGKLVPNEHADAVREAFELRAGGGTWKRVAEHLAAAGVPSRTGRWSTTGARSLIENAVYLGTALSGARRKEGAHEAVVGRALFSAANARTGTRAVTWAGSDGPLLGGLIKCGTCGGAMSKDWTIRKGTDKRYASYKCKSNLACPRRAGVSALQVEPYILDLALGALGAVGYEARGPAENVDVTAWEAQLDALRAEEAELDAAHAAGEFSATAYAKAQTALERRRAEVEAARPKGKAGELYTLLLSETGVRDAFESMTVPDRRKALGWLVERVEVAPGKGDVEGRVRVTLTDFDPAGHGLLPRPLVIDGGADGERFVLPADLEEAA